MLNAYSSSQALDYKLACDGADLLTNQVGKEVIGPVGISYALQHTKVDMFQDAELLLKRWTSARKSLDIQPRQLSEELCDKYQVGYFEVTKDGSFDTEYVLFNKEQLRFWHDAGISLYGLRFMVCPSRGLDGQLNGFGFRLLNQEKALFAFKWLFPQGQDCTFGLHSCLDSKRVLLVEGFLDYLALKESGHSCVVGLGSTRISKKQAELLKDFELSYCFDLDYAGLISTPKTGKQYLLAAEGKDPYEVFCKDGRVSIIAVADDR